MKYKAIILGLVILFNLNSFSNNLNDTINVTINLRQVDSLGLKIRVLPSNDLKGNVKYQFPKSIPGLYEYLNSHNSIIKLFQNGEKVNSTDNSFSIKCDLPSNALTYTSKSTVSKFKGISAEDSYYLKDSIYILNWHYLLGYFNTNTERPYKIKIIKDKKLLGTGTLPKIERNDTVDIFIANNYKELIHNPIMYSIPDTTNFKIGETSFTISCAGNDSLLNAESIKNLLINPLTEIISKSHCKPENYSFLFYSEYSLTAPYLTGLEHPNSTLICYHSALLDNDILVNSSIHEFIHAIFAPLNIRSEVINNFNFADPKCDELLWFYEGVTEYLTIKTLVNSGFFSPSKFFDELNVSNNYYTNIKLNEVSSKVYEQKGQELFDNFYTKGSLFAFQLDIEIIKKSEGEISLFDVMQNLQKKYNSETPFDSKTFIQEFSQQAGVDLQEFIIKNASKKTKIKFTKKVEEVGYSKVTQDTLIWSYSPKKVFLILNYKKNMIKYGMRGSILNKEQNNKIINVYEINGAPLTWFNYSIISAPKNGEAVQIKAYNKNESFAFTAKPEQILKKDAKINWIKNKDFDSKLVNKFWDN